MVQAYSTCGEAINAYKNLYNLFGRSHGRRMRGTDINGRKLLTFIQKILYKFIDD
jgi:hypothetical protein